jgi:two-component system response regulator
MSRLILIVDDREDDRYLLERHIRKVGVTNPIHQLTDGDKTIQFLSQPPFSDQPILLFLDLKMPRVDGFSVLEWLRDCPTRDVFVVIFSELSEIADIKRAYSLGARSYLTKPLQEEELLNLMKHFPGLWQMTAKANMTPAD